MASHPYKKDDIDDYQKFKIILKDHDWSRVFVIHGEESFLKESCRNTLRKTMVGGPTEEFNYHLFTAENWNLEDLSQAIDSIPMMNDCSLIEVLDVNIFSPRENNCEELAALLSDIPDYCTICFSFDALSYSPDKRTKLYKAIAKVGKIFEMEKQPDTELIPWLCRLLRRENKRISPPDAQYLIFKTGRSMANLRSEIPKLCSYTDQAQITQSDIDAVVVPVLEARIFDLTNYIGSGNFDDALRLLQELLQQDTEPIPVCALIGQQMRQLYAAKVLSEHGKGASGLASLYRLQDFVARKIYQQARHYQKGQLRTAMALCAQTDYALKNSGGNSDTLLETLVLRLGHLEKRT